MSAQESRPYIGGQAVLEGVMMRAPGCMTVAVRRPDTSIAIHERPFTSKIANSKLWKLPAFRGVATLVESLSLGYRALNFSAEQQMTEEELEKQASGGTGAMVLVSTLFAIGLFVALPQLLASGAGALAGVEFGLEDTSFHIVIGVCKLLVVTAYMVFVSRIPEMRRVFQYHGAEHKTIYAYEQGLPLTVENVQKQSTLHPRCGTTFLIMVIAVSVVMAAAIVPLVPLHQGALGWIEVLLIRIGLLPVVAALTYELQRLTARYCTRGPLRVLLWPGFLFQKITTREPDDDQVEIAIAAMQAAEWRETAGKAAPASDDVLVFDNFLLFSAALPHLRGVQQAS